MKRFLICIIIFLLPTWVIAQNSKDTIFNDFDSDLFDRVKSCINIPYESVHLFKMKNINKYENKFASIYDDFAYYFNLLYLERQEFSNCITEQFDNMGFVNSVLMNKEIYSSSYSIGNTIYIYGDFALAPIYEYGLLLYSNYRTFTFVVFSPNNLQFSLISSNANYLIKIHGITLDQKGLDTLLDLFK